MTDWDPEAFENALIDDMRANGGAVTTGPMAGHPLLVMTSKGRSQANRAEHPDLHPRRHRLRCRRDGRRVADRPGLDTQPSRESAGDDRG